MLNKTKNEKKQLVLRKLRKACKHATSLHDQLSNESADVRLQSGIYLDYLAALLNQERGAYEAAILHYSKALIALQNRDSPLMPSVETGLRFTLYQTDERSTNLQKYALQCVRKSGQSQWESLVREVDPRALEDEKSDEMITSVEWAGHVAHLTNSDMASAISSAMSRNLSADASPNDYDAILASWSSASNTLESLLRQEEDQDRAQSLEVIKAWLTYHSLKDHIARDKALAKTLVPREGAILFDGIDKTYAQLLEIPGLSDEVELTREREEAKAQRCVTLAAVHGTSLEALALLNRAAQYCRPSTPAKDRILAQLKETNARYNLQCKHKTIPTINEWFFGDIRQAKTEITPVSHSVTMKPVVFDIAWNYISGQMEAPKSAASSVPVAAAAPPSEGKKGFFGMFAR